MSITDTLTQRAGPLPVWAWGAVGAAGIVAARMVLGGSRQPAGPVILSPAGGAAPTASSPLGGLGSLLGGLTDFICKLPNSPNNLALTLPDGTQLSFGNGVPTFSGAAALGAGDQWQAGAAWNPCKPEPPASSGSNPPVNDPPAPPDPPGPRTCPPGKVWSDELQDCVTVIRWGNPNPPGFNPEPGPVPQPEPVPSTGYGWPAWFVRMFPWAAHGGVTGPNGWVWQNTGGQPYQPGQI